ncbi:MAG: potassium channel family protein [Culicoidibacterales bacterium]
MKHLYIEMIDENYPLWQRYLFGGFALNTFVSFLLLLVGNRENLPFFQSVEAIILLVFVAEYGFRIYRSKRKIRYIVSVYGMIDLLACFPVIAPLIRQFQLPALFIGLQIMSGLRVLKFIRLILAVKSQKQPRKSDRLIVQALYQERELLIKTASIILSLALTGAILVYSVEHVAQPEQFTTIFDAFWWAFITFTTVGYGDLYPITTFGRIIAMAVSVLGIAMFAIPTTLISSALIQRMSQERQFPKQQATSERLTELSKLQQNQQITQAEYAELRAKILNQL